MRIFKSQKTGLTLDYENKIVRGKRQVNIVSKGYQGDLYTWRSLARSSESNRLINCKYL